MVLKLMSHGRKASTIAHSDRQHQGNTMKSIRGVVIIAVLLSSLISLGGVAHAIAINLCDPGSILPPYKPKYSGLCSSEAECIPWDDRVLRSQLQCDLQYDINLHFCSWLSCDAGRRPCESDAITQLGRCTRSGDRCRATGSVEEESCVDVDPPECPHCYD
jgi:hypothetical protein